MKFKANKSLVIQAIGIVSKAISATATLPVLSNILLEASDGKLTFTATDLDLTIKSTIQADIEKTGSITVNGRMFQSYLNLLSEPEIEFSANDTDIDVKTSSSKTKFKGIKSDDFPKISKPENGKSIVLQADSLRSAISEVIFSVSESKARPILTGVLFSINGGNLSLTSTDSYRMSHKMINSIGSGSGDISVIIPSRTLSEIGRIIGDFQSISSEKYDLNLIITDNQIFFEIGNISIYSRLIEGSFPNCQALIPKSNNTKVVMNKSDLLQAVKRLSIFAKEDNNKIIFNFADGKLNIKTASTQIGSDEVDILCAINGDNVAVALNGLFVIDILSAVKKEEVAIEMTGALTPVVFKNIGEDNYVHIIMPLRS